MKDNLPFDLPAFMLSNFGRVDFGGDMFGQWPVGIRFEIGIERISRALKLYEFAFAKSEWSVLVSADWSEEGHPSTLSNGLFETPGIFSREIPEVSSKKVWPFDEAQYLLSCSRVPPFSFDWRLMFHGIAYRERPGFPKISSGVYEIDPQSKLILHMYDDRGLDIIATNIETLRPLFEGFNEWILDNQRHRIEFRFDKNSLQ